MTGLRVGGVTASCTWTMIGLALALLAAPESARTPESAPTPRVEVAGSAAAVVVVVATGRTSGTASGCHSPGRAMTRTPLGRRGSATILAADWRRARNADASGR